MGNLPIVILVGFLFALVLPLFIGGSYPDGSPIDPAERRGCARLWGALIVLGYVVMWFIFEVL